MTGLPTLVVVSGPAGAGKTTLAHRLAGAVGCPVISRDEIKEGMVHGRQRPGAPRPLPARVPGVGRLRADGPLSGHHGSVPGREANDATRRGITWYDILGVLPSVSARKIQREYDAKASLLRPELISGASSAVVKAASRAQGILDAAWRVLGDPVSRELYDEEIGFRRSGEGLTSLAGFPSDPGWGPADFGFAGGWRAAGLLGTLLAIGDLLAPHPRPPGRVPVPDVRGLFYSVCLQVAGRLGLQATAVRLTDRPMPVDGLVVDQSPLPPAMAHRGSALTVQVWHPPVRPAGSRPV